MQGSRTSEALAWLREQQPEMEQAIAALAQVNSFTANRAGGNQVGALYRQLLQPTGLRCELVQSTVYADHLVFSSGAAGSPVVLVGHLDTVFPPGTFDDYRREGELLLGPGVLDMKGGLVVMAFAALALARVGALSQLPLRMIVVSDEEVGSPEGQCVLREHAADASCGLVFEAGRERDAIVTQRKGTGSLVATAGGRAAHAGNSHAQGINAIWALSRFIDRAQTLTDYAAGNTVNVGKIEGGQGRNTVPDRARADLDIRFLTRPEGASLVARLQRAAEDAAASVPGSTLTLTGGISRDPLELSRASEGLFREYAACAAASGLGSAQAPMVGGGSDANTLSAMGIPSIDGLGPRGTGFHTRDERIELASLVPKAEALVRFLAARA
jgi:glutamate carboxypeptidase